MKTKQTKTLKATYNYKILKDKKLIIEAYKGDISLEFLKDCMLREFSDPNYEDLKFGICDLRNSNFILSDQEIKELFEFSLNHDPNLSIKWATLTQGPYETAMSMIFGQKATNHYGYKIFSTLDAASEYLKINLSKEDFKLI